ncbi:hypothetical protein [Ferruginibacter sp.]|uniref:hypothetical protein n=1 Tax=Ferruginibacter sp. TaxID=1940288 RepID=UPI0019B9122E|nr:hypothetical protein [Ferruginibacter sp.]MBC7628327.1 VOC family protein [Ferruginibacter sp.]
MLLKAVSVLPVTNITDAIDFYKCKLGFKGLNFGDYAILKCMEAEIHLSMADPAKQFTPGGCYIFVDNIEDLYADFSAKNLIFPRGQLVNKPRGFKEFIILDNNGNVLRFGQKK